jgi:hypothetical protein
MAYGDCRIAVSGIFVVTETLRVVFQIHLWRMTHPVQSRDLERQLWSTPTRGRFSSSVGMSQMGQNAKYSSGVDVFRFDPENGHAVMRCRRRFPP